MKLYIDIDGVLLGKKSPNDHEICLAKFAKEFLTFSIENFDCYWLTTHCNGSVDTVVKYLSKYGDEDFISLVKQVKSTKFTTYKTEALSGEFYWIDDQPTAYEIQYLDDQGWLGNWIQINTRQNYSELQDAIDFLKKYKNFPHSVKN